MPQEDIAVILAKLEGLREVIELRFKDNEAAHKAVTDHLAKLYGQTAKSTEFCIKQKVHNKWIYSIMVLLVVPVGLLLVKTFIN